MAHSNVNINGSVLKTDKFTKDLGHPIEQAEWTAEGVLVLFKFGPSFDKRMRRQNVVLVDDRGEIVWTVADNATPAEFRPYTGFQLEPEGPRLYSSLGGDFRLDLKTGNVTLFDFSK